MSLLLDALKNAALEKQKKDAEAASLSNDGAAQASDENERSPNIQADAASEAVSTAPLPDTSAATPESHALEAPEIEEETEEEVLEMLVDIDFDEDNEFAPLEASDDSTPAEDNELDDDISEEFLELTPQSLANEPAPSADTRPEPAEEIEPANETATAAPAQHTPDEVEATETLAAQQEVTDDASSAADHAENDATARTSTQTEDTGQASQPIAKESEKPAIHFQAVLERNKQNNRKRIRRYIIVYSILVVIALLLLAGYYFLIVGGSNQNFTAGNTAMTAGYAATDDYDQAYDDETLDAAATDLNNTDLETTTSANAATAPASTTNTASPAKTTPTVKKPPAKKQATSRQAATKQTPPSQSTAIIRKGTPKKDLLSETIDDAYAAYTTGDYVLAEQKYRDALSLDPLNRDAILGAAAVRMTQQKYRQALDLYQRQLTRDPQDEYAHAGILSIASVEASSPELLSRVNDLLKTYPNAGHLHFLKGRLLAQRFRWAAAQASFFNAWSQNPERADYAYNLAISLDHIKQQNEALKFYRRAISGRVSTLSPSDLAAIDKRIAQLEAQP